MAIFVIKVYSFETSGDTFEKTDMYSKGIGNLKKTRRN